MGETISAREAIERMASSPSFSSGSPAIDSQLGGGFRQGRIVEVYGRSGCGKTQLAMQSALQVAAMRKRVVFIDTEGAFRPERILAMAKARSQSTEGLLDRITFIRVRTAVAQVDAVRAIAKKRETEEARTVIIDTFTRNFTLDYPGRANLRRRQGALDVHISELARDAFTHERAYLLTNRVTFSQGGGETRIGGRTMEQLVHESLHLEKNREGVKATRISDGSSAQLGPISDSGLQ